VKLAAFLRVRQMATVLPFPFLEECLKALYLAYARNCKFVTEASLPGLTLMGNCVVELYGLDMTSSYQHAFVYIRQLALHLRSAYTKKTPEALQRVHGWQYVNCLKVGAPCRAAHASSSPASRPPTPSPHLTLASFSPLSCARFRVSVFVPPRRGWRC
jgi:nucleolar complex protein 2